MRWLMCFKIRATQRAEPSGGKLHATDLSSRGKNVSVCVLSCFPPRFTPSPFIFYNQRGCILSHCPPLPKCVIHLLRIWNLGYFDITSCRFYRSTWRVCLVPKHLLCLIYPHRLSGYSDDLKLRKWEGAQLAKVWHRVWLRLTFVLQSWAQAV